MNNYINYNVFNTQTKIYYKNKRNDSNIIAIEKMIEEINDLEDKKNNNKNKQKKAQSLIKLKPSKNNNKNINTDDSLNKFNDLLNLLNDGKKRLEKYKYNYFSDCKSVIEQENKLIRLNDNKIIKQEEISKINSDLGKYINLSTCSEQSYKDEITKMNKLLENNEDTYTKIVKSFRECHNKKISELTRILKNFISDVLIFTKSQPSYIEKLDKIGNNIQISRDMILYDEKFNYYNDYQKRFLLEKFLDYRKFSKNLNRRTYSMENPTTNNSAGDTTLNYLFGFITGNSGTINTEKTENKNENK